MSNRWVDLQNAEIIRHKTARGDLLRILAEYGPGVAVPHRVVLGSLFDLGYDLTDEDLDFHLRHLCEYGYVRLAVLPRQPGRPEMIKTAALTAEGLRRRDNLSSGDDGVLI